MANNTWEDYVVDLDAEGGGAVGIEVDQHERIALADEVDALYAVGGEYRRNM